MIIVSDIQWDTEGQSIEECILPRVVLVAGVQDKDVSDFTVESEISEQLSEAFGFCHAGFTWAEVDKDTKTHAGGGYFPVDLGFINLGQLS